MNGPNKSLDDPAWAYPNHVKKSKLHLKFIEIQTSRIKYIHRIQEQIEINLASSETNVTPSELCKDSLSLKNLETFQF